MSERDRALLTFKLRRMHVARKVSAILVVLVPVGFAVFSSMTPTDFGQASSWALIGGLCLFLASPFVAFWIGKRRAIARIEDWLEAGEVSLMRGAVMSKGAHGVITIGDRSLMVWPRIYALPVGHEVTVEFLPTNDQPRLQGVLRINGDDNPYFANAVMVAPPD